MALWKTLLIVVVIAGAWLFAPDYYQMVALMGGLVWLTEFFRSRNLAGPAAASIDSPAKMLGLQVRSGQRGVKFRWHSRPVHLTAAVTAGTVREHVVYELALPAFRKTPFCFVMRHVKAVVREAELVENSRIPGTRFEYALERVDSAPPLEAAANMPDLYRELMVSWEGPAPDLWAERGVQVQKVFFNGRVLHTHILLDTDLDQAELRQFLDQQVAFQLTLLTLVDKVDFKVPS